MVINETISSKEKKEAMYNCRAAELLDRRQGDLIGRIFDYWSIIFFGLF
jgi:hypothetical protein